MDWTTCPQPCGREIRLGLGARLREVSHSGRLGLVVGWKGDVRILDLRRIRYVDTHYRLPKQISAALLGDSPRVLLTRAGQAIRESWSWGEGGNRVFGGLDVEDLATGRIDSVAIEPPKSALEYSGPVEHGLRLSRDDRRVWYERSNETVQVVDLETHTSVSLDPVPGQVIQQAWVDSANGRLATGTYGAVHLHRIAGVTLTELGTTRCPDHDILSVQLAGHRLMILSGRARAGAELRIFDIVGDAIAPEPIYRHSVSGPVAAALSARGDRVAISRTDHAVELHTVGGDRVELDGHTDTVRLVRFARNDDELITADDDNRILIRPRIAPGYARHAINLDLPSDAIPFPDLLASPD